MTPEEEKELAELEELDRLEAEEANAKPPSPDEAKAAELAPVLDPSLSLPAQVLSTQPATTNPKGDEAAQSDWVVKGTDAAKKATMVYEPPLATAKKDLLSNPQLVAALFPDEQIPPEFIQNMDVNSDIYKAYADKKWDDVRWAAADSGTTAYRYSKAPWLHGAAAGLSPLGTLATKARGAIDPLVEGASSFLLGMDDTAAFGAGRRAGEALDRADPGDRPSTAAADTVRGASATGGVSGEAIAGADPEAVNEMLIEQSPGLHTAGQVAGMFTPTGVLGLLGRGGSLLTHGAGALAAKAGGGVIAQGAAKLAGAGVAAAAGGTAMQAGREGVEAAANLGKTGEAGTTLGEAANRSVAAGLDPANLGLGVGGELAGMAAGGIARGIARSPRYHGNVERVEQLGGKIKLGQGPVGTDAAEAAIKEGKTRDISPQDVIAERIAPKIAEAENAAAQGNFQGALKAKEEAKKGHGELKQQFFSSREGQAALAPVQTLETNLKHLRSKMTTGPDGQLRPVGNAEGVATARGEFSGDIAKVSLKPEPGAIELSPEEAEAFLSPSLTRDLAPGSKPPSSAPPSGAGPTPVQSAGPPTAGPPAPAAPGRGALRGSPTVPVGPGPEVHKGQQESMELEGLRNARGPMQREARRMEALADTVSANKLPPEVQAAIDRGELPDEALQNQRQRAQQPMAGDAQSTVLSPDKVKALRKQSDETAAALSEGEVDAIRSFTSRKGDKVGTPEWQSAVKKLTIQNPTAAGPLYHGTRMSRQQIDETLKSGSFATTAPTSLSYNKDLSDAFSHAREGRGEKVMLEVQHLNEGQNLLSPKLGVGRSGLEREINLANPTKFKVVGSSVDGEGVTHIRLQDASASGGSGLAEAIKSTTDKSGLSSVSAVVKAMGGDRTAAHKALLEAEQRGAIELRPEGALKGRFSKAEEADMLPGPEKGMKLNPIRVIDPTALAAIVGTGAALAAGDSDSGAVGASAVGLALALKKRGVRKVYAVPRRYDAQQHEVRIGQLQDLTKDPKAPGARESKERYAAALRDRQQRPMNGQPGAWSAMQDAASKEFRRLDESLALAEANAKKKGSANREAPGGTAAKRLVRYAAQKPGELPLKKEIEAAGGRAGVSQDLRDLRLLDPLQQLRQGMTPRRSTPGGKTGIIGSIADQMALRALYPGMKSAGSDASHLRGGLLGTKALQLKKKKDEEAQK